MNERNNADDADTSGTVTFEHLVATVKAAAAYWARRATASVADLVAELSTDSLSSPHRTVDTAFAHVLRDEISQLWINGWLPYDVYQMTRRHRSEPAVHLAVDMIAEDSAQHAPATIHPRWQQQLEEIEAVRWWVPGQPVVSQWAQRHRLSRHTAVTTVVELLALFMTMGKLPVLLPLPGQTTSLQDSTGRLDDKMLSKVRALLAKAESTSFSEEAETLSAKAHELMSRHSLERALEAPVSEVPTAAASRIWLDAPYIGAKSLLVSEVASAHRCRTVSYEKLGFVTVLGDDVDINAVQVLTTSLMVQATRAMLTAGRHVSRGGKSRTRSFRHSFLIAYATRIGERLRAITEQGVAESRKEIVPVFAAKKQAVDDLFASLFAGGVSTRSFSIGNVSGYGAGRAAAEHAVLGAEHRTLRDR
ncbi:DUF2786 domain-containing protein [Actinobacteria bacterium YIM 96077]|uniref:DUF2786 domain-containing protein n=1 Tax=Phytoactinopolyspora halophila TaxID=1981511 RepID=A0A329R0H7_9ACTN|nr:DUF2786 domain-containing protein [Phytoactinopolyspora halophila]AYY11389.1 DUF2786 domain-containing protein [Actinobacteria bacterium YIM 96077]RAW18130.1 DUF2786 domain-containing protein [Phytoactinopolyspora halophila]